MMVWQAAVLRAPFWRDVTPLLAALESGVGYLKLGVFDGRL